MKEAGVLPENNLQNKPAGYISKQSSKFTVTARFYLSEQVAGSRLILHVP